MKEPNAVSYFVGLITGALLVGGIVAGYFTEWRGEIPSSAVVAGTVLAVIFTLVHIFSEWGN